MSPQSRRGHNTSNILTMDTNQSTDYPVETPLEETGKGIENDQITEALPQAEICSADYYFTDDQSGEYRFPSEISPSSYHHSQSNPYPFVRPDFILSSRFDRSQLSEAHSACQATAEALCQVQLLT